MTSTEIDLYYKGVRDGIERGVNLDAANYSHYMHHKKMAELAKVEGERQAARDAVEEGK